MNTLKGYVHIYITGFKVQVYELKVSYWMLLEVFVTHCKLGRTANSWAYAYL